MSLSGEAPSGGLRRFNVSPSMNTKADVTWTRLPVISVDEHGNRTIHGMVWPLIPYWCHGELPKFSTANCRSEPGEAFSKTVAKKPAFKDAWQNNRRCLIPFSWFYEWDQRTQPKQPWMVSMKDHPIMVMAGLWEVTQTPSKHTLLSCTIVTTAPNRTLTEIGHHRSPVILQAQDWDAWLTSPAQEAQQLMQPPDDDWLKAQPVSVKINNPHFQEDVREIDP